jgi:hypothetical protein
MIYVFASQEINGSHSTTILRHPIIFTCYKNLRDYNYSKDDKVHNYMSLFFETQERLSINQYRKVRNRQLQSDAYRQKIANRFVPGNLGRT